MKKEELIKFAWGYILISVCGLASLIRIRNLITGIDDKWYHYIFLIMTLYCVFRGAIYIKQSIKISRKK